MNSLDTLEAVFRGGLQNGVSLTEILNALRNVSAHGELIGDGHPDEDMLIQLFNGYELAIEAARELEGR